MLFGVFEVQVGEFVFVIGEVDEVKWIVGPIGIVCKWKIEIFLIIQ